MERWKINLYIIWFSQILSMMSFSFGMPFLPFYIQELGIVDPDKIKLYSGMLNAAPAVTMAIMAPIWGMIADKFGRKLMLLRAVFCASLVIGGMGLVSNAEQLIALRLFQGIFTGTVTASTVLVAANTPRERLAFALGFLSSSTFIGQSVGPVIGGFVAEAVGYRVSFFIGSLLMLTDFFLVLFIVKEGNASKAREGKKEKPKASLLSVFAPLTTAMLLVLLLTRIGRSIFNPYLPLFIQELRQGAEGTARVTGMVNGVVGFMTAVSALTLSRLGDKYNKMKLLSILLFAAILASAPLSLVNNLVVFTIAYASLFFIVGGIEPIIMSVTTEHTPKERRGVLFGIQGTVGSIAFAAAPALGGYVSIQYSIRAILILMPVFLMLAVIAVAGARVITRRAAVGSVSS
jgi:MFS transporter, DHA1 family, multidrug resistance protein